MLLIYVFLLHLVFFFESSTLNKNEVMIYILMFLEVS